MFRGGILLILLSIAHLPGMAFGGNVVWLETERFDDHGGWVNDSQFIDQMGSPYLLANGMGKGPALTLLLAGPALSLPNMLVIRSVMGIKKTLVFIVLVVVMATITGIIFGYCVS